MDHTDSISQLAQQLAVLIGLIVTALIAQVITAVLATFNAWVAKIQSAKLDTNTQLTVAAKDEAHEAAVQAVQASVVNKAATSNLEQKVNHIGEAVNGRTSELIAAASAAAHAEGIIKGTELTGELVERMSAIEQKHSVLAEGLEKLTASHGEVKRALDKVTEASNVVAAEIRKGSKY